MNQTKSRVVLLLKILTGAWAFFVGCGIIVQTLAAIEPATETLVKSIPVFGNILALAVSLLQTPITMPLWGFVLFGGLLLLLSAIIRNLMFRKSPDKDAESEDDSEPQPPIEFREVWLNWHTEPDGEIVFDELRCAKDNCHKRLISAGYISDGKFLVCEDGHKVGNELSYDEWKLRADEEAKKYKQEKEEYERKVHEEYKRVESDVNAGVKTKAELDRWLQLSVQKSPYALGEREFDFVFWDRMVPEVEQALLNDFLEYQKREAFRLQVAKKKAQQPNTSK